MIQRSLQGIAALLFAGMVALAIYNLKAAAARCDALLAVQERGGHEGAQKARHDGRAVERPGVMSLELRPWDPKSLPHPVFVKVQ